MTEDLDNVEILQQFRLRAIDHIESMKGEINILWATYNKMPVPKTYPTKDAFESDLFAWCLAMENQFTTLRNIAFDQESCSSLSEKTSENP